MRIDGMRGVFVTAVLAGLGTADAFSSSLAAPSLLRGAPAARAALRGPASAFGARSLRAQMRPEDKQGKRAEADAGAAWQEFVRSAREGWQGAAAGLATCMTSGTPAIEPDRDVGKPGKPGRGYGNHPPAGVHPVHAKRERFN